MVHVNPVFRHLYADVATKDLSEGFLRLFDNLRPLRDHHHAFAWILLQETLDDVREDYCFATTRKHDIQDGHMFTNEGKRLVDGVLLVCT